MPYSQQSLVVHEFHDLTPAVRETNQSTQLLSQCVQPVFPGEAPQPSLVTMVTLNILLRYSSQEYHVAKVYIRLSGLAGLNP
jgi:hypothetical protein